MWRGRACMSACKTHPNICYILVKNTLQVQLLDDQPQCSYLPVYRAVIFQYGCDKNRPLLGFVFLLSDLKLSRPQIKVELIEAEL